MVTDMSLRSRLGASSRPRDTEQDSFRSIRWHYRTFPELYPDCPCCSRPTRRLHQYSMSRSKVICLGEVAALCRSHPWVKLKQEGGYYRLPDGSLVKSALRESRRRCQNLVLYGFLHRVVGKQENMYRITQAGRDFLAGRIPSPRYIRSRDGVPEEISDEQVYVHQVRHVDQSRLRYALTATHLGKDPFARPRPVVKVRRTLGA